MTYLDIATAVSFWTTVLVVVVLVGLLLAKRYSLMSKVTTIAVVFQMVLFVTIIVDDLLIKPTMQCYDRGGQISAFVNHGTPGCTK